MSEKTRKLGVVDERLLHDLWAAKHRGLKLSFDDVLEGLARAKLPFSAGIVADRISTCIEDACRDRTQRGTKGYSAKNFRFSVAQETEESEAEQIRS